MENIDTLINDINNGDLSDLKIKTCSNAIYSISL